MDALGWPAAATIIVGLFGAIASVTGIIIAKILAGRPTNEHDSEAIVEHMIERFVLAIERGITEGMKKMDSTRFNAGEMGTLKEWARNEERRVNELELEFKKINEPLIRWAMTVPDKSGPH